MPALGGGEGPVQRGLMNKFKQVSSDGHQVSLAGGKGSRVSCFVAVVGGTRAGGGSSGLVWGEAGPSGGGVGPVQWSPMHHG